MEQLVVLLPYTCFCLTPHFNCYNTLLYFLILPTAKLTQKETKLVLILYAPGSPPQNSRIKNKPSF